MDIKKKRSNNGRINNLYELLIDPREREKKERVEENVISLIALLLLLLGSCDWE